MTTQKKLQEITNRMLEIREWAIKNHGCLKDTVVNKNGTTNPILNASFNKNEQVFHVGCAICKDYLAKLDVETLTITFGFNELKTFGINIKLE